MGERDYGLDTATVRAIAEDVRGVVDLGVEVCLVIGGGNIFRGIAGAAAGMDRAQADYMGMLATVMNALGMQSALEKAGVPTRVQSAIAMQSVCEPYIRRRAIRHMEKGRVVILAAGTGNPYFTTDTAAALRSLELDADAMLMAKNKVDGVYSADPRLDTSARRYRRISHQEAIERNLKVMDTSALALLRDNDIPIVVFDVSQPSAIEDAAVGREIGTRVQSGKAEFFP